MNLLFLTREERENQQILTEMTGGYDDIMFLVRFREQKSVDRFWE